MVCVCACVCVCLNLLTINNKFKFKVGLRLDYVLTYLRWWLRRRRCLVFLDFFLPPPQNFQNGFFSPLGVGGAAAASATAAGLAAGAATASAAGATASAAGAAAASAAGFEPNNELNNPPDCFLVPLLALRLLLRATLDLCLVMIVMNNYILNEDINI